MLNIAITAGGTSENMDGVRKITNVSTGSLGWYCLEAVLEDFGQQKNSDFHVYYLLTGSAAKKDLSENQKPFVTFIPVTDAASAYYAVENLMDNVTITHFIHSMAVSDFTFSYAVSLEKMASELFDLFQTYKNMTEEAIKKVLYLPESRFTEGAKISSESEILMGLTTTRKIISLIKKKNKNTVLVGFKLLSNTDESQLMLEAERLTRKNDCDLVLANEVSHISETNHQGILIKKGKIIARPSGKKEIANSIVKHLFDTKL